MNKQVESLYNIAGKKEKMIIGLMSGTPFDGLDIALCKIRNHGSDTELELLNFETTSFPDEFKNELKVV